MSKKIINKPVNQGKHARPHESTAPSSQSEYANFHLRCDDHNFCLSRCTDQEKAAFADRIHSLSKMTWAQIHSTQRHGMGCEKIATASLRRDLPGDLSPDTTIWAFRCFGLAPMVGYREGNTFKILWFDPKFELYPHE